MLQDFFACFQVLDLIAFICASVWIYWAAYGGGWVQFVTMAAFITTLLLFGFHLFRIIYKLPGPWGLIVSFIKIFEFNTQLMLSMLGKYFSRAHFEICLISQKIGLDISCRSSP